MATSSIEEIDLRKETVSTFANVEEGPIPAKLPRKRSRYSSGEKSSVWDHFDPEFIRGLTLSQRTKLN